MATHDYNIANQTGADFRADLNNALLAIVSNNSNATSPSTTYAYQLWVDTANNVLKLRNSANSDWITTGISITASNSFTGDITGNSATATALATARTINGVSFDGTANISFNTDSVSEGSSNLYFTNERVDDQVNSLLTAGSGISLTYDDAAGTLTIANTNSADITSVVAGDGLTGGGTSGDVTLAVSVDDSSIEINSDTLRVKASGITNSMLAGSIANDKLAGSIANSKLANSSVTINSQAISLGGSHTFDSDDIGEGSSNLYFTNARARGSLSIGSEGSASGNGAIAYNSSTGVFTYTPPVISGLSGDTDDLSEGSSNLYYTDARANAAIDARVTNTFINNLSGVVADTATALATARSIALSGDVTASGVNFDGTGDITLSTTIAANSVALGTDTTGNYVATVAGTTNEIEVSGSGSETASVTIGLPDNVTIAGNLTVNGTTTSVNTQTLEVEDPLIKLAKANSGADSVDIGFYGLYDTSGSQDLYAGLFRDASDSGKFKLFKDLQAEPTTTVNTSGTGYAVGTLVSNLEGDVTGNAATATALETARAIALSGDVVGTANFDGTAGVSISTTIQANSVALGTDTTGDYVSTITAGTGLTSTGATSGEGVAHSLSVDAAQTQITSVGALDGGSITSGFGSIDVGSSAITTSGTVTGGTLAGTLSTAAQTNITSVGTLSTLTVDDITINGSTISDAGDLTLDVGGDIILDAGGDDITFKSGGTEFGSIFKVSNDLFLNSAISDGDIKLRGNDGGSFITALTLDMSDAGAATFNSTISSGAITSSGQFLLNVAAAGTTVMDVQGNYSANGDVKLAQFKRSGGAVAAAIEYNDATTDMEFGTVTSHAFSLKTADTRRLTIDSSGLVGIGTASPLTKLTVSGDYISQTDGTRTLYMGSDGSGGLFGTITNHYQRFITNNTERMRIDASGNLLVGKTSGTAGNTIETNGRISAVAGSTGQPTFNCEGDTNTGINLPESDRIQLVTAGTEAIRIDSSQRVGIGTSSPSQILNLKANTPFIQFNQDGTDSFAGINFGDDDDANDGQILYDHDSRYMRFQVANNEKLRIDSSGNVGIGTSSPSKLLHLKSADPVIRLEDSSPSAYAEIDGAGGDLIINCDAGDDDANSVIKFKVDNSEKMRIDSAGTATFVRGSANGFLNPTGAALEIDVNRNPETGTFDDTGKSHPRLRLDGASGGSSITFHTADANNTVASERGRFHKDGHFLVNCTAAQGVGGITLQKGTGGVNIQQNMDGTSGGAELYVFRRNSTQIGSINQSSTNAVTYNTSSDARLKDVTGSSRGLDVINNLNPVAYNWKADNHGDEGLIAQEVEQLVPNAVNQDEDGYYSMDYSKLVTHLVKGMQEQQEQIESLKSEIANLKEN